MELHPDFTNLIVSKLPEEVRWLCVIVGSGIMVAGGFARDVLTSAEPKDVDIFGRTPSVIHNAASEFEEEYVNACEQYTKGTTENAISFVAFGHERPTIQFITRDITNVHMDTLKAFDFTNCQVGVYFDDERGWQGICTPEFTRDLPAFALRFTSPPHNNAMGSLLRAFKFVGKGWKIDDESIAQIIGRVDRELETINGTVAVKEEDFIARAKFAIEMARRYPVWAPSEPAEEVPF